MPKKIGKKISRIVTHGRQAHRDDFLAVALALTLYGVVPVFRREPTEDELGNPRVLVLDVGGRYEPALRNFDHHQRTRDEPAECALSLFVRHQGLEDAFLLRPWWRFTVVKDAHGPRAAAQLLGLEELPIETISPIEGVILNRFARQQDTVDAVTIRRMAEFGEDLLDYTKQYADDYNRVKEMVTVQSIDGLPAFVIDREASGTTNGVLARYRSLEHPDVVMSVARSPDKEASWALYRYDDDHRVDFRVVDDDPRVKFVHSSGFLAVLRLDATLGDALELCKRSILID